MMRVVRIALYTLVAASVIPTVVSGQETSADTLSRRIDVLERRAADLERRVRELEALIITDAARSRLVAGPGQAREIQNWRRLRLNMTMDQVRPLLGEPERVVIIGSWTYWYWDSLYGANVRFENRSGKVDAWSEPRR